MMSELKKQNLHTNLVFRITPHEFQPFVYSMLQKKVESCELQEACEVRFRFLQVSPHPRFHFQGIVDYDSFKKALYKLLNYNSLFQEVFGEIIQEESNKVLLEQFAIFINSYQRVCLHMNHIRINQKR